MKHFCYLDGKKIGSDEEHITLAEGRFRAVKSGKLTKKFKKEFSWCYEWLLNDKNLTELLNREIRLITTGCIFLTDKESTGYSVPNGTRLETIK